MKRAAPLAALFVAVPAGAQNVQPWPTLTLQLPITDKLSLSTDSIERLSSDAQRPGQWESRSFVNARVTKRLTLSLGYAHVVTYQATGANGIDNEVNEQALWTPGRLAGIRVLVRTRLEQRFQRGDDGVSWRLREQLRGELPVGGKSATSLVVWTEPFINVDSTRLAPGGFAQIRNFAGISVPLGRHATAEFGYLNQYQFRAAGDLSTNAVPLIVLFHF